MFDKDLKDYKVFISHINQDDQEHNLFLEKLNDSYDFKYEDCAVRGKILTIELIEQIKPVDVVVILSGLCSKEIKFVTRQIDAAIKLKKPILVIRPYGLENVPSHLEELATDVIGWNTSCIVDAIKELVELKAPDCKTDDI